MKSFSVPWICSLIMMLACEMIYAQAGNVEPSKPPEVDAAEALRRGNTVRIVGEGPRGAAEEAIIAATAPPPDDSHMWYVTVFRSKNDASVALSKDFNNNPNLAAFVRAPDNAKAWAHYNEYDVEDATQVDRIKRYKLRDSNGTLVTPVVVVQPPRNGMWGDARIVVTQQAGYDGDSKELARKISTAVKMYASKMAEQGYPKQIVRHYDATQGARQTQSAPPFSPPSPPNPFSPVVPVQPAWPDANPNIPTAFPPIPAPAPVVVPTTPTTPTDSLLGKLGGLLFSPGTAMLIMIALQIAHLLVLKTPSTADDQILAMIETTLKELNVVKNDAKPAQS